MDWQQIGLEVLSVLLPVIAAILTAMVSWGISLLARRWKLNLDVSRDAIIRNAVRLAIAGAEEYAARKLKYGQKPISGGGKADWVKARILALWPNLLPSALSTMIDEELALMCGVGATGARAVGTPSVWFEDNEQDEDEEELE